MSYQLNLRRFYFDRQTDVSGTSGIGAIVEGIEFSDGQVVLRWRTTPHSSIALYKSMEAAVYIHGHNGSTNLHYIDEEQPSLDAYELPTCTEHPPEMWDEDGTCSHHAAGFTQEEINDVYEALRGYGLDTETDLSNRVEAMMEGRLT